MATFPTTKTVPLDKDIGVVSPFSLYLGTVAREQLSVVLSAIDQSLKTLDTKIDTQIDIERTARITKDNNLQSQMDTEVATRLANDTTLQNNINTEASTRLTHDQWLEQAIASDRKPLSLSLVSSNIFTVNGATPNRYSQYDGSLVSKITIISGVFQSDFNDARVNFDTGTVTYNYGLSSQYNVSFSLPSLAGQANKWTKASIVLLGTAPDTLLITFSSSFASTEDTVPAPVTTGGVPIGIISFKVNSTATGWLSASSSNITQIPGASAVGTSGSGSESFLDPMPESSFLYYTRSDFAVDRKSFIASTTGADQVLGLSKVILAPGQYVLSKDLTGSMIKSDAATVNFAQVKMLYSTGKADYEPVVEMSLDGGSSWYGKTAIQSYSTSGSSNFAVANGQKHSISFTSSVDFNLSMFQLFMIRFGVTSGNVSVSLYSNNSSNNAPLSELYVGTSYATNSINSSTGEYVSFMFSGKPLIPAGTYHIVISPDATYSSTSSVATGNYVAIRAYGFDSGAAYFQNYLTSSNSWSVVSNTSPLHGIYKTDPVSKYAVSQGNQVAVDFSFPTITTPSFSSTSAATGASVQQTGAKVAAIFTPTYNFVITSFEANLRTTSNSTTGKVRAYIYAVTSGMPSGSPIVTAPEIYTLGTDITSTASYKSFTFSPVTLSAGTNYALAIVSDTTNGITWLKTNSTASHNVSLAYYADPTAGSWTPSADKLMMKVYGNGLDIRAKITSVGASELLGFGVDMLLDTGTGYSGETSYEQRIITQAEATSGTITLSTCKYVPGAHQLHANVNGHDFMAPDFAELGPSTVQFPANFFQAGDAVKFYVGYGLVDGSSASLAKLNVLYEAVVGSQAQVAAGVADFTSIQTAINTVNSGAKITILQGTYTENITINKELCIHGKGRSSIINGTVTFGANATGSMLKFTKLSDNVTISISAQAICVTDNWLASGKTVTGGTNCLILNIGE